MSRRKIIQLDEQFHTGEPTVQPVVLWGPSGKPCYERLTKEANYSPARDYIKTITPVPGRTIVLIIGMGSYEWYGLNRNGDGFNERPYNAGVKPTCGCCGKNRDAWITEDECIQNHYKTYETGTVFLHHCNSDPKKGVGRILKAFWNPYMHRVEVLEDLDNKKAPHIAERIENGDCPPKSMGCRVKFDVCTKCGHMAPTRKQYCDHLKWSMGKLEESTGIRYGALNPNPRLFDSSWVFKPADRCGYMLKKVATAYEIRETSSELGERVDALRKLASVAKKLAAIDKVIRGYPAALVKDTCPESDWVEKYKETHLPSVINKTNLLSEDSIKDLASYSFTDVLKALSDAGIILTTPEFVRLFAEKMMPGIEIPPEALHNLTQLQGEAFDYLAEHPTTLAQLCGTIDDTNATPSKELQEKIGHIKESRDSFERYLKREITPSYLRMEAHPRSELITVVDPATGDTYQTTHGARVSAEKELGKARMLELLGSGGLLASAYKTMKSAPGAAKLLSLPLAGGGVYLGQDALAPEKKYIGTEGEEVPYLTEFRKKESSLKETIDAIGIDNAIANTKNTHKNNTMRRFFAKTSNFNINNTDSDMISLASVIPSGVESFDGITDAPINLDKAASIIGAVVCELY